ncbi:MAG: hypothetical protein AAF579_19840 [Cyanobacteria bacterium P01_C01_bin.118]
MTEFNSTEIGCIRWSLRMGVLGLNLYLLLSEGTNLDLKLEEVDLLSIVPLGEVRKKIEEFLEETYSQSLFKSTTPKRLPEEHPFDLLAMTTWRCDLLIITL